MGTAGRERLIGARGRALCGVCVAAALAAALVCSGARAEPAAWRIAGTNGGEVALLGSMHVLRKSDHPLPALVDDLYERADVLVMELDIDDPSLGAQQAALLGAAVMPPATGLRDVLDAKLYELTTQRASELGVNMSLLEHLEPWLIAITLLDAGMQKIGFEPRLGVERYVAAKAVDSGKEIRGLETLATQIAIFDDLAPNDQAAMLAQTLQELNDADDAMDALVAAWRAGELEAMTDSLLSDFADFPRLYETLVTRRNAAWTTELERLLDDGRKYLVIVGALHLVGPDNVIERLEARGHRAVRVMNGD